MLALGIVLGLVIGVGIFILTWWLLRKTSLDTPETRADQAKAAEQLHDYYSGGDDEKL